MQKTQNFFSFICKFDKIPKFAYNICMTLLQIQDSISSLPEADFWKLTKWMEASFSDKWDADIEADFAAGKLDNIITESLAEHKSGKSSTSF